MISRGTEKVFRRTCCRDSNTGCLTCGTNTCLIPQNKNEETVFTLLSNDVAALPRGNRSLSEHSFHSNAKVHNFAVNNTKHLESGRCHLQKWLFPCQRRQLLLHNLGYFCRRATVCCSLLPRLLQVVLSSFTSTWTDASCHSRLIQGILPILNVLPELGFLVS